MGIIMQKKDLNIFYRVKMFFFWLVFCIGYLITITNGAFLYYENSFIKDGREDLLSRIGFMSNSRVLLFITQLCYCFFICISLFLKEGIKKSF